MLVLKLDGSLQKTLKPIFFELAESPCKFRFLVRSVGKALNNSHCLMTIVSNVAHAKASGCKAGVHKAHCCSPCEIIDSRFA